MKFRCTIEQTQTQLSYISQLTFDALKIPMKGLTARKCISYFRQTEHYASYAFKTKRFRSRHCMYNVDRNTNEKVKTICRGPRHKQYTAQGPI